MLGWCKPRSTEKGNSCRYRTTPVWNFVEFLNERGKTEIPTHRDTTYVPVELVPHFFTKDELARIFTECDKMWKEIYQKRPSLKTKLNMLECPVFFRLLFSSGLRTCEARWLKRSDVDFATGVINVEKSKGTDRHRVVLHDSMKELLNKYDKAIDLVMSDRVYLFPDKGDKPRHAAWESYHFRNLWARISSEPARPYDFRHHYATTNISEWENHGYELSGNLLFLSRSMGHKNIQSTYDYFHLTPMLTDKLKKNCSDDFNSLLPEFKDEPKL